MASLTCLDSRSSAGICPAKTLFNISSWAHAKSPKAKAPAMRPLPFKVWKARRISVNRSRLCRCWFHLGYISSKFWQISFTSSQKISKISSPNVSRKLGDDGMKGSGGGKPSELFSTSVWFTPLPTLGIVGFVVLAEVSDKSSVEGVVALFFLPLYRLLVWQNPP